MTPDAMRVTPEYDVLRTIRLWLEDLENESKSEMTQMERNILDLIRRRGVAEQA